MILITQILRPGQNKLHKEAARRLWKVCSNHCSIASILHFSGHLLHISWRGDLRAIAAHFPPCRWLLCSLRFGRCECTEVARGFAMAPRKQEKQELLVQKVANKLVCVGNQMLRFFYLPGSCGFKCRVSTVRKGPHSGYAPRGIKATAASKVHFPLRKKQSSVICS